MSFVFFESVMFVPPIFVTDSAFSLFSRCHFTRDVFQTDPNIVNVIALSSTYRVVMPSHHFQSISLLLILSSSPHFCRFFFPLTSPSPSSLLELQLTDYNY